MLNLQFAETMELTEAELQTVYGGQEHLHWLILEEVMEEVLYGKTTLTLLLQLLRLDVVIDIQSPCLFLG